MEGQGRAKKGEGRVGDVREGENNRKRNRASNFPPPAIPPSAPCGP